MPATDEPPRSQLPTPSNYRVYLVRCWREESTPDDERSECPSWRFVVVTPRSRQRRAFGSLEELFASLRNELECDGNGRR
jgi:hypothetical protein